MSQPRYSKLPAGSLFPVEDNIDDLRPGLDVERKTSYILLDNGIGNYIMSVDRNGNLDLYAKIPTHYGHLVRRFLWRISVLDHIISNPAGIPDDTLFGMACNMRYAFEVLRYCRPAFRDAARRDDAVCIPFFDAFMLEEHYVGRHEPSAVILWQREHPDVNLRTANVFALGMFYPPISLFSPAT